jgi:hypothetical protein
MRQVDKYAGWRSIYVGEVAEEGYVLEPGERDWTYIKPKSEARKAVIISNLDEPAFLDLLNLECGVYSDERVLKFVNKYGVNKYGGIREESIGTVLACSQVNRELVGKILDFYANEPVVEAIRDVGSVVELSGSSIEPLLKGPPEASCRVHLNLITKELVIEAKLLSDFVYLQIMQVFSQGMTITNCEECGAYMMPSRSTRAYCNDLCRKRANRAK